MPSGGHLGNCRNWSLPLGLERNANSLLRPAGALSSRSCLGSAPGTSGRVTGVGDGGLPVCVQGVLGAGYSTSLPSVSATEMELIPESYLQGSSWTRMICQWVPGVSGTKWGCLPLLAGLTQPQPPARPAFSWTSLNESLP